MLYMTDENGNLIPIATDNQGNESGKWVDVRQELSTTQSTTETSVDISSLISDYDANGEYECLIQYEYAKSNDSVSIYIGSDIINPTIKTNEIFSQYYECNGQFTIPLKKYLKYRNGKTGLAYFHIYLLGYRRIR